MKKLTFFLLSVLGHFGAFGQKDHAALVNPFIGTGGHGHTFPGASMPFGAVQLSPDTRMADWDGSSGYHYSDSVIYGFSHTHLSGTGIPDYCDVLFMPFSGEPQFTGEAYRSGFSHSTEKAAPGYYEVLLDKRGITARLTATARTGFHQYRFPEGRSTGSILIDLKHRDALLDVHFEQVNAYEVRGFRRSRSWAGDQVVYFHAKFDRPIQGVTTSVAIDTVTRKKKVNAAALSFTLDRNNSIQARVGISAVSLEGARLNLEQEGKGWDFEKTKNEARKTWNRELSKIEIRGGTKDQQTVFYTALYHCFLAPNIFQDVNGRYRGTDGKVHTAKGFTNYTVFSLWDTYRAYHPLMTILNRKRTRDWINTFLQQYKNGGMLPVWELAGNETFCMIGYHSVSVIADAYRKGIRDFDTGLALKAMRSYAESNRFGLGQYRQQGYISNEKEHESVSKTLEYAYDDWCIAQFAKMTGNKAVHDAYMQRAQHYKNLFDPASGHMRGKLGAMWYSPFDPREVNNFYTEGNSWQYSFAVPHDIEGLIGLHGGRTAFGQKLDQLFTAPSQTTGREQADITGLIGQYAHGNEPSHHMAYLYNYLGRPWRTQELVHQINTTFYKNAPDGLIGNEDCGQMSAWHVLSALGFYPVTPGDDTYVLGTPLFDEAKIHLENGKSFVITRKGPAGAFYLAGATLNGSEHAKSYIRHGDLAGGGRLEFLTAPGKTAAWSSNAALPISRVDAPPLIPVPYVNNSTNKFRKETRVTLKSPDPGARIMYAEGADTGWSVMRHYDGPFSIDSTTLVTAVAMKGEKTGAMVEQHFFRIPNDYSITVATPVHPMYTGGGPDALVDGIKGSRNWKGEFWQSYFDTDFEAIVDLKEEKDLSYLAVHVLQDPSPWILFPKEAVFYGSADGLHFREISRFVNSEDQKIETIRTQELGGAVKTRARYLKVKAFSAGKLPAWHESAGNPSHLFIDEIIIR